MTQKSEQGIRPRGICALKRQSPARECPLRGLCGDRQRAVRRFSEENYANNMTGIQRGLIAVALVGFGGCLRSGAATRRARRSDSGRPPRRTPPPPPAFASTAVVAARDDSVVMKMPGTERALTRGQVRGVEQFDAGTPRSIAARSLSSSRFAS